MGLRTDETEKDDGGGAEEKGRECNCSFANDSCSICLEVVADDGNRSWAKLNCGHLFHLDCIGSAFNTKGAMQCPNCRNIEKGKWLFGEPSQSANLNEWTLEGAIYGVGYTEMSVGIHWCPFGGLGGTHPSFEEGEFSSNAYHDHAAQHPRFAEPAPAVASASHHCPYVTYFGPLYEPSSSSSVGSVSNGSISGQWSSDQPMATEIPSSSTFPAMDHQYHSWERYSVPLATTSDPPSNLSPPIAGRSHSELLITASVRHPSFVDVSDGGIASGPVATSLSSPYRGINARFRDRERALQAYSQQQPGVPHGGLPGRRGHRPQMRTVSESDGSGQYFASAGGSGRWVHRSREAAVADMATYMAE